jgi:hypothetical protein
MQRRKIHQVLLINSEFDLYCYPAFNKRDSAAQSTTHQLRGWSKLPPMLIPKINAIAICDT